MSTLIFTVKKETQAVFIKFCQSYDILADVEAGGVEGAIKYCKENPSPDILIIDISGVIDVKASLENLANFCEPTTQLIVVGDNNDVTLYKKLLEIGAGEYFPLPLNIDDFIVAYRNIAGEHSTQESYNSNLITFIGAKGGVGVSSLLASTATYMSKRIATRCAVIDFNFINPDMDLLLDTTVTEGVQSLLENPEKIDTVYMDRVLTKANSRLRTVISNSGSCSDLLTHSTLDTFFENMEMMAHYTFADVSHNKNETDLMQYCLENSKVIVIVLSASLSSLRDTKNLMQSIKNNGFKGRVITILNKGVQASYSLDVPKIEESIGSSISHIVPIFKNFMDVKDLKIKDGESKDSLTKSIESITSDIMGVIIKKENWLSKIKLKKRA